ncbi:hypothetical protein ACVWZM_004159 [Bradyrhizobium sp. USDA 4501]
MTVLVEAKKFTGKFSTLNGTKTLPAARADINNR